MSPCHSANQTLGRRGSYKTSRGQYPLFGRYVYFWLGIVCVYWRIFVYWRVVYFAVARCLVLGPFHLKTRAGMLCVGSIVIIVVLVVRYEKDVTRRCISPGIMGFD